MSTTVSGTSSWVLLIEIGCRNILFALVQLVTRDRLLSSGDVPLDGLAEFEDGSINHTDGGATSSFNDATTAGCFGAPLPTWVCSLMVHWRRTSKVEGIIVLARAQVSCR